MPDAAHYSRDAETRERAKEGRAYLRLYKQEHLDRQEAMGVDYELGVLPTHANGDKEGK